uniref:KH domain-containing protein n=1 Tax=Caenorhabditis japonica TaxID=281687 RepID=A0A8R1HU42_CAEJA
PERIVTITGTLGVIGKAFNMVCNKFEEDMLLLPNSVPKPPITMRVIVPATQCGSLIGKGGSKIKDIREATGASIQVASEMLPHSTERAVTLSGTADAINLCMAQVCQILLEAPPKGATITYRPKPTFNPLAIASSAATIAAQQQQAQAQQQLAAAALMGGGGVQQQLVQNALLQQQQFAAVQQEVRSWGFADKHDPPKLFFFFFFFFLRIDTFLSFSFSTPTHRCARTLRFTRVVVVFFILQLAARAALFGHHQLMMPGTATAALQGQSSVASSNQELFLGQNGLIYTASGAQIGADGKAMEAGAAAAAAAQWQSYDVAALQQQQQQQQQQLMNQYALNQSMLIGAPFVKSVATPPTSSSSSAAGGGGKTTSSGTSGSTVSSRFHPY